MLKRRSSQINETTCDEHAACEHYANQALTLNGTSAGRNVVLGLGLAAAANVELFLELVHC